LKFKLVKLPVFSGERASLYSIIVGDDKETLFDQFIRSNIDEHRKEIEQIFASLDAMGKRVGVQDIYFRKKKEGKAGDGVEAIYDYPTAKLRLYCIRYGNLTLILGDGGEKNVRTWQDDPQLSKSAREMIEISKILTEAIKEGDLTWDGNDFIGQFEFNFDEEDDE
jgi:hypothetical protein